MARPIDDQDPTYKNDIIENNGQESLEDDLFLSGGDSSVKEISHREGWPIAGEREVFQGTELNQHQPVSISISVTNNSTPQKQQLNLLNYSSEKNNFNDDSFDLEAFESAFGEEDKVDFVAENFISNRDRNKNNMEFLSDSDEFDNLSDIPIFELIEDDIFHDGGMLSESPDSPGNYLNQFVGKSFDHQRIYDDEELFTISAAQEVVPVLTKSEDVKMKSNVILFKTLFGFFETASLKKKQWWIAGTVGVASVFAVFVVNALANFTSPVKQRESITNTNWLTNLLMPLSVGATGTATTWFMTNLMVNQIRRSTKDLQTQFNAIGQGNMNVAATVYAKDELGQLATDFNNMVRVILASTEIGQGQAIEQKETKENQVVPLVDEVTGEER